MTDVDGPPTRTGEDGGDEEVATAALDRHGLADRRIRRPVNRSENTTCPVDARPRRRPGSSTRLAGTGRARWATRPGDDTGPAGSRRGRPDGKVTDRDDEIARSSDGVTLT